MWAFWNPQAMDFKVNFVEVILWANSHKLSSKLRIKHN